MDNDYGWSIEQWIADELPFAFFVGFGCVLMWRDCAVRASLYGHICFAFTLLLREYADHSTWGTYSWGGSWQNHFVPRLSQHCGPLTLALLIHKCTTLGTESNTDVSLLWIYTPMIYLNMFQRLSTFLLCHKKGTKSSKLSFILLI